VIPNFPWYVPSHFNLEGLRGVTNLMNYSYYNLTCYCMFTFIYLLSGGKLNNFINSIFLDRLYARVCLGFKENWILLSFDEIKFDFFNSCIYNWQNYDYFIFYQFLLWSWKVKEKLIFYGINKINIILYRFHNQSMIILGIIEIHPKGCTYKIIFKGMRVLLILYFLNRKILVYVKLYVYMWNIWIKSFIIKILRWCIYLKNI
jgi:hypothetical protein